MNVSSVRIAGWGLLVLGIMVIFYAMSASYLIFTAKSPVPEIFPYIQTEDKTAENPAAGPGVKEDALDAYKIANDPRELQSQLQAQAQAQMQEEIGNQIALQLKNILPDNFMPKILNFLVWSIFTGIIIFAGGRISGIGAQLLKQ